MKQGFRLSAANGGPILAAVIGVLIQIQPIVLLLGQETRLALSDPIVGLVALAAAIALATGRVPWRIWRGTWVWLGVAAMTLVLAGSFVVGYSEIGRVSSWALQNRLSGWAILMAYLLCGGALAVVCGAPAPRAFLQSVVIVGGIIAALAIGGWLMTSAGVRIFSPFGDAQLQGLLANPNAYGLFAVLALAAIWLVPLRSAEALRGALAAVWSAAAYLTYSRATWIAGGIAVAALVCWRMLAWRRALLWMLIPIAALVLLTALGPAREFASERIRDVAGRSEASARAEDGIGIRIRLAKAALELWRSSPLMGVGLGVHWHREQAANPAHPLLIHSTPLWLLAETGLVGLAVFAAFAAYAIFVLAKSARGGREDAFVARVALVLVIGFAVMSLFHDLLYQRILWLMLGFALAVHKLEPSSVRQAPISAR
jgi:O-antigen ligase